MRKRDITRLPASFEQYVVMVDEVPILQALKDNSPDSLFDIEILEGIGNQVYAAGKWTIKDILQHCIDTERIMCYRALTIARNDDITLPGFDENQYAGYTNASQRSVQSLIFEFALLRRTTLFLFENFTEEMLKRSGVCNYSEIDVLALGYVIVGHALHHRSIINKRYLNAEEY